MRVYYLLVFSMLFASCNCNDKKLLVTKDDKLIKMIEFADSVYYTDSFRSAIKLYSTILSKDSTIGSVYFNKAYSESRIYDYENSIRSYKRSIALGHREVDAFINVGCNFMAINEVDSALVYIDKGLKLSPKNAKLIMLKNICKETLSEKDI